MSLNLIQMFFVQSTAIQNCNDVIQSYLHILNYSVLDSNRIEKRMVVISVKLRHLTDVHPIVSFTDFLIISVLNGVCLTLKIADVEVHHQNIFNCKI